MTASETPMTEIHAVDADDSRQEVFALLGLLFGLTVLVVWSYWNSLAIAADQWMGAQYSHGWLVPLFAIALLVLRGEPYGITREAMGDGSFGAGLLTSGGVTTKERVAGGALLLVGLGGRLYCSSVGYEAPELFTIMPVLAGVFLLVGGGRVIQWAGPSIAFLFFMCPLPWSIADRLFRTLQGIATGASTFVLQILGFPAFRSGNMISLGPDIQPLNVIDQCSGLRMLTIFVALSFAVALVSHRPIWERIVIILSSVPIALAVNVMRISITGMMHVAFHGTQHADIADKFFHDFAGWIMMPMAMVFLFLEFVLLQYVVVTDDPTERPAKNKKQKQQRPSPDQSRRRQGRRRARHNPAMARRTPSTDQPEA
jgi:exosortase